MYNARVVQIDGSTKMPLKEYMILYRDSYQERIPKKSHAYLI
jgi:hypothetical protein